MKKFLAAFALFCIPAFIVISAPASASETLLGSSIEEYPVKSEKLYLDTISAIAENRFDIVELQSKTGTVLFRANKIEFLATVYTGKTGAGLKILPANSDFSIGQNVPAIIFTTLNEMTGQNGKL